VSLESDYTFRQEEAFTAYGTETPTPAWWLINAAAGTDFSKNGKSLFFDNH
jgi:iron complex outermembrane receptor protein